MKEMDGNRQRRKQCSKAKLDQVDQLSTELKESHAFFGQLAENMQDVFFLLEWPGRKPLYITSSFERFWGVKIEEVFSRPDLWLESVHPEDRARVTTALALYPSPEGTDLEYRLMCANDQILWVRDRWFPIADDTGQVRRVTRQVTDITEHKRAECCLRRLATVVTDAYDAVTLVDLRGDIEAWNRGAERMYGYTEAEAVGMSLFRLIPDEKHDAFQALLDCIGRGERIENCETQRLTRDGRILDIWLTATPLQNDAGRVTCVAVTERDITERKVARQALAASEALFRGTFEQAAVGMAHLSPSGLCERVNQRLCHILGLSEAALIGRSMGAWTISDESENDNTQWEQLWQGQRAIYTFQKPYLRLDESTVWLEVTISRVLTPGPESDYAVLVMQDISQRKAHERRVAEHQQQLKDLASKMTLAEEHLKRQVAIQLHDTIGQSLAISKLKLESLKEALSEDEIYDDLTFVCQALNEALQSSQSLTARLSYPTLTILGLEKAIEKWLASEIMEKHGIQTRFLTDQKKKPLTEDLRLVVFRSIRELLNNVVKHAQATRITVSISREQDRLVILVEDNGMGYDSTVTQVKGGGFGLLSIREALEHLDATLTLSTHPGQGCRATLTAPLMLEPA